MNKFIISESWCGDATTKIVKARNMTDVKRHILLFEWRPNARYFWRSLERDLEGKDLFCVIVALCSGKKFDVTSKDIGEMDILRDLSNGAILASIPDSLVDDLFDFAFSGGEGEQKGNPGKEWRTITVTPFLEENVETIYNESVINLKVRVIMNAIAEGLYEDDFYEDDEDIPCCSVCDVRMTAHGTCSDCLEKKGYENLNDYELAQVYHSRFESVPKLGREEMIHELSQ